MSSSTEDLWPQDFGDDVTRTPAAVLAEQAALLSKKTNGLLEAEVKVSTDKEGDFVLTFEIVAPTLNYRYRLFQVWHGVFLYPVSTFITKEEHQQKALQDETAFKEYIKTVLGSDRSKRIINALLLQSRLDASANAAKDKT